MSHRTPLVCVLVLLMVTVPGDVGAQARRISLTDALYLAARAHPAILAAAADVAIVRGEFSTARVRLNPEASFSVGPARSADTSLTTGQVAFTQTIELWGKRRLRSRGAEFRLEAASARLQRQTELIALDVRRAFKLAIIAQVRVATALDADSVGRALQQAAEERLQLGAGTQLELNVAAAAAARDRRARLLAEQALTKALYDLQAAVGIPPAESVLPEGSIEEISSTRSLDVSEDSLVQQALAIRADLKALALERDAADRAVRLADAMRWPDPAVGFGTGRAEDFRVRLLTVSLPFPVWNRSAGARATAVASLQRASIDAVSAQQAAEREVRVAFHAFQRAVESTTAFDQQVVARLRDNLDLANESFRSGKISLFAYTTLRRDLVAARLDYLDALADVAEREYALAAATGERLGGSR